MTTDPQTVEPIRKDLLPCTPPAEWEFHTVLGARSDTGGVALFPGDTGPVVIRRRVTYGDWEPVRPDHWAEEPSAEASAAAAVPVAAPPTTEQTALRERVADGQGEPTALRNLPREVRHLVHAVDRMRGDWAESSDERRAELWRVLHEASDAVWNRPLSVLPAPADRAATLREAATRYEEFLAKANTGHDPRYWTAVRDVTLGLRAMADEQPAVEAGQAGGPSRVAAEPQPAKPGRCPHGCDTSTCPCLACEADDAGQPAVGSCAAAETPQPETLGEWCKCPSCWGWFVEDHPGEDLDELGKDLGWWSGLPEHRDAPAAELISGAQQCGHDDGHEWADRPNVWCPGISVDEPAEEPRREPHPTEADLRHALAVLNRFHGRDTTTPAGTECARCGLEIENRGDPDMGGNHHARWVHVPGGYTICHPWEPDSPRAAPAVVAQPGKETAAALLSSECDACRHTLNWHRNDVGCTVDRCACSCFRPPAAAAPAVLSRPGTEQEANAICVCGHGRSRHVAVNGRLLCDECEYDDPRVCAEFTQESSCPPRP